MFAKPVEILLVEDNPADVRFAQETLKDYRLQNTMNVVTDGEEAIAYLRHEGKYRGTVRPDLVLLDIHLPRKDGREVFEEIGKDVTLKNIPVAILTSSPADKEILEAQGLKAECYVMKPLNIERLLEAMKCFDHFGITMVTNGLAARKSY